MWSRSLKFEFLRSLPQSERHRYLAELSQQCEQAGVSFGESPGFSIASGSSDRARIDLWNPSKEWTVCVSLRDAEKRGILRVTRPKDFSASVDETSADMAKLRDRDV
jgi:hypothetical protein